MAPATNLGAASPVAIGGAPDAGKSAPSAKDAKKGAAPQPGDTMMRKVTNDAAAYIRSLAQLRGRNADWAERAVREGVSLPAAEARKLKVIDILADSVPALLEAVDGRTVVAAGEKRKLATAGADMIAVPAAFTRQTGEAHWHVLLRARAIETGAYVLAAAQGGLHENGRSTYGHSMIVSPWGEVLAEAGEDPQILLADVDLGFCAETRAKIPSLKHGREFEVVIAGAKSPPQREVS